MKGRSFPHGGVAHSENCSVQGRAQPMLPILKQRRRVLGARGIDLLVLAAILIGMGASAAGAQQNLPMRSDYDVWLHKYLDAKPTFKPGDVLTEKDIERIQPFVPPGYLEQLNFPGMRMEIAEPEDHTPRQ